MMGFRCSRMVWMLCGIIFSLLKWSSALVLSDIVGNFSLEIVSVAGYCPTKMEFRAAGIVGSAFVNTNSISFGGSECLAGGKSTLTIWTAGSSLGPETSPPSFLGDAINAIDGTPVKETLLEFLGSTGLITTPAKNFTCGELLLPVESFVGYSSVSRDLSLDRLGKGRASLIANQDYLFVLVRQNPPAPSTGGFGSAAPVSSEAAEFEYCAYRKGYDGGVSTPVPEATATPTPSPTPSPGGDVNETLESVGPALTANPDACFPSSASVELESGELRYMNDLNIGDSVRVGPNKFSKVFFFGHRHRNEDYRFLRFKVRGVATELVISANHLIYVKERGLVPAAEVDVKDELYLGVDGSTVSITEITTTVSRGLYAPHTTDGDIVVDGILVSSYTNIVVPLVAHALLSPFRLLQRISGRSILQTLFEDRSYGHLARAMRLSA